MPNILPKTEIRGGLQQTSDDQGRGQYIDIYTDFTMIHMIYTIMMTSLCVVVHQTCGDIMCISGYLNLKS